MPNEVMILGGGNKKQKNIMATTAAAPPAVERGNCGLANFKMAVNEI